MPGLGDLLYDLFNPQEAGAGMGASPNVRMGLIEGQRMPPDPRMQAYAQQMPPQPQMAQAPPAPGYGDPMSGQTASGQPPMAPQPAPDMRNLADALYNLMSPAMGGGGGRY